MYRKSTVILVLLIVLIVTATSVSLAGRMKCLDCTVSSKGGGPSGLSLADDMFTASNKGAVEVAQPISPLDANGTLTGLGKLDVNVQLSATAATSGIVTCTNYGGELVEAQSQTVTVTFEKFIPSSDYTKNGTTGFSIQSGNFLPVLSPGQFCPNNNWTARIEALLWRGPARITATQTDGSILTKTYNCYQPEVGAAFDCQAVD